MSFNSTVRPFVLSSLPALALVLWAAPAGAQVIDVVVGVTPACPYGISACWGGAYEALGHLEGVDSVAKTPDAYNCTAQVRLKGDGLPDVDQWPQQFKSLVGDVYVLRGVEATVEGSVEDRDGVIVLKAPGVRQPIVLAPLKHKLQWNFRKGSARQPEPDERDALQQLAGGKKDATEDAFKVQVTGPLKATDQGFVLEVREFFPVAPRPHPARQDK